MLDNIRSTQLLFIISRSLSAFNVSMKSFVDLTSYSGFQVREPGNFRFACGRERRNFSLSGCGARIGPGGHGIELKLSESLR
jgi:hypothetical protein